jgi:hypothetical protein
MLGYFVLFGFAMFILGILFCPVVLFLRARKDDSWDNSNMTNIIRVVAHIATHPSDFAKMQFEDGTKPFWYLNKDEFADVVKTRPKD